jgi:DNA-binding response OmpR family regulator
MAAYKKILIVEDEPTFRSIVVRNLRARGFEVEEAENTDDAIALLTSRTPDLILLDINLPGPSGWELLRHLKASGRHIPTIIVSAVRVNPERLEEFKPLAYLPKPFPLEALLRIVENGAEIEAET